MNAIPLADCFIQFSDQTDRSSQFFQLEVRPQEYGGPIGARFPRHVVDIDTRFTQGEVALGLSIFAICLLWFGLAVLFYPQYRFSLFLPISLGLAALTGAVIFTMITWLGHKTLDGYTYLADIAAQIVVTIQELFRPGQQGRWAALRVAFRQMLFTGEEGLKPTEALSGGETARMLFCRIMLQKPNVLILDEPTNHLDLGNINTLERWLTADFSVPMLIVSHDREFLDRVVNRIVNLEQGKATLYRGN